MSEDKLKGAVKRTENMKAPVRCGASILDGEPTVGRSEIALQGEAQEHNGDAGVARVDRSVDGATNVTGFLRRVRLSGEKLGRSN